MRSGRVIANVGVGAAGIVAAGAIGRVARRRQPPRYGSHADDLTLGDLRSDPLVVVADDGVALHVEVDEPQTRSADVTIVFVHGFALTLDSWHFQRSAYRGQVRTVFYDQRSHGRSGRSSRHNATIEQLGRDLMRVIRATATGQVVLVGHSMGGMTILALAEQQPQLFGDLITGVALIATTSGSLDVHKMFLPLVPSALGDGVVRRTVQVLSRGHRVIDRVRRATRPIALVATDQLAFGDEVPKEYVEFVDGMLSGTGFAVLAEFFPNFASLDKRAALAALAELPVTVVGGTDDQITAFTHSVALHEALPQSDLVECVGAGHLLIMEREEQVNDALDLLVSTVTSRAEVD
ncbi:MAG: alpha/beta fold hydrolase [Nocardioides sp.]